jgi:hypothetical protein
VNPRRFLERGTAVLVAELSGFVDYCDSTPLKVSEFFTVLQAHRFSRLQVVGIQGINLIGMGFALICM